MEFGAVKLPDEAEGDLTGRPVGSMKPHELLCVPFYVHMKLNSKFVLIKRPFDFFTEEDLKRLEPVKLLYSPNESDKIRQFKEAAVSIKEILMRDEIDGLAPSSYETSDDIMKVLSPLWDSGVDPFYATILANELCTPIASAHLIKCREASVVNYERGFLRAGWVVFLGLHLGYSNLLFLSEIRERIIREVSGEGLAATSEVLELIEFARRCLGEAPLAFPGKILDIDKLGEETRTFQKLSARLKRNVPKAVASG